MTSLLPCFAAACTEQYAPAAVTCLEPLRN